ncbi:MAG: tail fiber domain-containing protein [Muribaculaceae bacterium]|nr:tail fiber domain-containing protein [Muribaculaceae bacterium]
MKKLTLIILSLITLSLGANAQLRVLSNGHIQLGNWGSTTSQPDTTSTISLFGNGKYNSGALLTFGGRTDVSIGETKAPAITPPTYRFSPQLLLNGSGGIQYKASTSIIFSYTPGSTPIFSSETGTTNVENPFTFNVNLKAPKFLTTSDARCKKNIEPIESLGRDLMELTPVKYNLFLSPQLGDETMGKVSKQSNESKIDSRFSYGFLAQEVQEIFPELVYEDENGLLSLDYNGFIPLLVDAYKDLKAQVAEQQETIANLTSGAKKTKGTAGIESLYGDDNVVLMQNRPNPFKATTEIKCHLPQEVSEAFICIYDLNGRQQMRLDIRERGDVAVTVSGSSLQPGMYIYSLIADGNEADSKRMILTE